MVKAYAQLAAIVLLITGFGGLFTGDASTVINGHASGNFDGVALHLTWVHDGLNLLIAAAFFYAGWVAPASRASAVVSIAAGLLFVLGLAGFIVGDDDAGTRSFAALHFPLAMNIFNLVAGTLGVLCVLGDIAEPAAAVEG
jgi:hypothetical protein